MAIKAIHAGIPVRSVPLRAGRCAVAWQTTLTGMPASIKPWRVEQLRMRVPELSFLHVPYKGAVESVNALRVGEIDFSILVLSTAMPLIKAGKLRALAVTTPDRVPQSPDVPTFAEAGIAQYGFKSWGALRCQRALHNPLLTSSLSVSRRHRETPMFSRYRIVSGPIPSSAFPHHPLVKN
ncbi:tripartite tricarboxylate transporter substrate-binding protein [Cupriavidus taiwanensis]|uniref:tripartite tricarboxylate transporter substrate-binding protein n=1 Tax=Cupriavidus taiwanensis TaxID=164546 RepID=UPI00253FA0E3|nr:tripartite tricarboxylate transporter substrate-binding protein [Cupriavidus taiwanensis]MDK3023161.1 tripartite tricarboxylate transporter substrate-binding protein [Cupriavidus taiwanensis]